MTTLTIKLSTSDRARLADEVTGSAFRLLLLAGLSPAEASDLFLQTATKIRSGNNDEITPLKWEELVDDNVSDFDDDENYGTENASLYALFQRYDNLDQIKSLTRLGKRSEFIHEISDGATIAKAMAILAQAAILQKQAIAWLKVEAEAAGVIVEADREQWIANASDDQLDMEGSILFLDEFSMRGPPWDLVRRVADRLGHLGDQPSLVQLYTIVSDPDLFATNSVRKSVEEALEIAGRYADFEQYVLSHAGAEEIKQAEFLDTFARTTKSPNDTLTPEFFLKTMEDRGQVQRFKRAGRWRLVVK